MLSINNLSIKNKIITIILLVNILVIAAGYTYIIINNINTHKEELVNDILTNTVIIGEICIPAISFDDKKGANGLLQKLFTIPEVTDCWIYDNTGQIFVMVSRSGQQDSIANPGKEISETYFDSYLHIVEPLIYKANNYGFIYVRASTEFLNTKIRNFLTTMFFILLVMLLLTYVLANKLQIIISGPILSLAEVTKKITEKDDYSLRVSKPGSDEIGVLFDGFNNMLEQIHIKESERNEAEDALRESEEKYRTLIQRLQTAIVVHDTDTKIIASNPKAQELLGLSEDQMSGKTAIDPDWKFFNTNGEELSLEEYPVNKVIATQQPLRDFTLGLQRSTKVDFDWVLVNADPVFDAFEEVQQVIITFVDITERKRATEALKQSYIQLQAIYNSLPVIIWSLDENGVFTVSEGKELGALGLLPGQVVGMSVFDLYKDNKMIIEKANTALSGVYCEYESEVEGFTYHSFLMPFYNGDKEVKGLNGLSINVTDKKKVEDELYRLRNYLSNIIDSMPSVLVGVDSECRVTQWNKTIEQTTGINESDAQGEILSDILPQMKSEMKKISKSIKSRQIIQELKRSNTIEKDAAYEDMTIFPLITNGVEGAVIRIDDVTEKVRMQEMMIQSEKMLSVGGLAAGMAHEINNPLAGMMQTAEVMTNRLHHNPQIKANLKAAKELGTTMDVIEAFMSARDIPRMLTAITDSGKRVAKIVENMLNFSRKSDAMVSSHNIEELIDKTLILAATDYDLKKQ